MLRNLGRPEIQHRLAAVARPQVSLNYLGRFDRLVDANGPLRLTLDSTEPNCAPGTPLDHAVEVNGVVRDGCFEFRWDYCGRRFERSTIERMAESFLIELYGYAAAGDAAAPDAFEFPELDLNESWLAEIETLAKAAGGSQ
jgi:non-ribosomal peptide synthase protein (TIGR01720 family)